jgi:hypothetical protein
VVQAAVKLIPVWTESQRNQAPLSAFEVYGSNQYFFIYSANS